MSSYFFTADEHYGHDNIIEYCNRPFSNVDAMDEALIRNHNEVVEPDDTTVHVGDFTLKKDRGWVENLISRLNGEHIFIRGSHDSWLDKKPVYLNVPPNLQIWEKEFKAPRGVQGPKYYIVACHYAMRVWPKAYHGSWQLYGHTHGQLSGIGPQMDVGVDTNNFFPYSLDEIAKALKGRLFPQENCHHNKRKSRKEFGQ